MFYAFLDQFLFALLTAFTLFSASVSAALQNATIDDQNQSLISYVNPGDWFHDPLIGWEYQFYNGSRSYTWIPGASASLTFTGSGVYLQGPPAPDQAQRRVFLDGRDMGAFNLKGETREYCRVFFAATQLPYTTHTIVVAHNDTPSMIFAMDAWFVEFDNTQSILPFTTTTTTQTAATQTVTLQPTDSNVAGINGTISGSPNTPDQNAANPKSYSTIIIAIVVPILLFLLLCIGGICIYRNRRARSAQRRRESFREKLFRRGPSPLTPQFGGHAGGTGLAAIGAGAAAAGRDSDESGAMSPSTRYETALDHEYNSDQDHSRGRISPTSPTSPIPMIIPPANILDPRILSAAMSSGRNSSNISLIGPNSPKISNNISPNSNRPTPATFDPPANWRTALGSDVPLSHGQSSEAHTHAYNHNHSDLPTASGTAAGGILAGGRVARSSPDLASNPRPAPSTVLSETESASSLGMPPARHYQLQDVRNSTAARDAEGDRERGYNSGNDFGSPPASPTTGNGNPRRSNSVLRRFSTAITLPFARAGSRPSSRDSNSHAMATTNANNGGGNGNRNSIGSGDAARNSEDGENTGGRGYFRGMNHFNLGIPLNYRPTATANNPRSPSLAATTTPPGQVTNTRIGRHSQNLNDRAFDDVWPVTRPGGLGASSNGEINRLGIAPTTPGTGLVQSPFDDFAFSSYTRQTRERVLSYPTAGAGDGATGGGVNTHPIPPAAPLSSLDSLERDGGDIEPEEKDDKIVENLDGVTMRGEAEDEGRWSVGHGTLASRGSANVGADGLTRTGSLARQGSVRSTADQGRGIIPPPYSVYIPPDTKPSPPPGSQ